MQKFVFWTGVYNIVAGVTLLFPGLPVFIGVRLPENIFWLWLPVSLVIYLGVMLILCSRDLQARACLVYWEGILRIVAFVLLAYFGFIKDSGIMLGIIGAGDLVIGLIYLFGLTKTLQLTHLSIMLDQNVRE